MNTIKMERFSIIGIAVRTTNENEQAMQDIPALWQRFFAEQVLTRIPGKVDDTLYCAYTDYEKDHTRPYTTVLGCRVFDASVVPEGMTALTIDGGSFTLHTAKGNLNEGVVVNEWFKIWNADLPRKYASDYEVYGAKAQDPANAEVDIFISVT